MKLPALAMLLLGLPLLAPAAESRSSSKVQDGQRATVTLLATSRVAGKAPPDGMQFLFLVVRKPDTTGRFTLKETRDFLLAGESYQGKTKAELGKEFEPETVLDTADGFFGKQPGMRHLAPGDITGANILTVAIGGAKLPAGAKGEITLNVGFDKQVEPFTFHFAVPPDRPAAPKP